MVWVGQRRRAGCTPRRPPLTALTTRCLLPSNPAAAASRPDADRAERAVIHVAALPSGSGGWRHREIVICPRKHSALRLRVIWNIPENDHVLRCPEPSSCVKGLGAGLLAVPILP